jgi:hypothetical protein
VQSVLHRFKLEYEHAFTFPFPVAKQAHELEEIVAVLVGMDVPRILDLEHFVEIPIPPYPDDLTLDRLIDIEDVADADPGSCATIDPYLQLLPPAKEREDCGTLNPNICFHEALLGWRNIIKLGTPRQSCDYIDEYRFMWFYCIRISIKESSVAIHHSSC